jgi:Ni/Fe-hydrogenase subunit HybB-like protein
LPEKVIAKLGWFLPWILGLYLVLKLGELEIVGELNLLFTSGKYSILFLTELLIGVIVPIILFSFKHVRHNRVASMLSAFLVMGGVVLNRFNASWFAIKPVAGESYRPHWMEVAILVGVASGVFLVYTLVGRYFPLFDETVEIETVQKPVFQPQLQPVGAAISEAASSD